MQTIPDPAWAAVIIVSVWAVRDVALAWIHSKATGAPAGVTTSPIAVVPPGAPVPPDPTP